VHKVFSVQDNGMTGFGMLMQSLGHSEKNIKSKKERKTASFSVVSHTGLKIF
jgi:hypothetical protein